MSDPMTAAATYVAQKGLEFVATKIYESSAFPCQQDPGHQVAITKVFCMAIRGAAGADEREFKQHLTAQIDRIAETRRS